jgi:phosphoglycerate dehydrogenase-like enzyme
VSQPTVFVTAPPEPWLVGALEPIARQAELVIDDDPAALAAGVERVEVVFAWPCARAMLEPLWDRAGSLRWLHYSGAGIDHLLFPALVESRVALTNSRDLYSDAIAEHALALLLALAKRLPEALIDQAQRRWEHRESELLDGKLLGIVGLGSIGRALARRARALGMRVWGLRRRPGPPGRVVERVLGAAELDCLLAAADWVVVAVPLTAETRGMIGAEQLRRMKPSAGLVNVARGEVVDERALARALREGWLRAAASDVFEEEPLPPTSPLYDLPNMLISPHMAPNAAGWRDRTVGLFLENFARYGDGRRLRNVVDKRRGY